MRWLDNSAGGSRYLFDTMGAFQRSEGLCHSKFFFSTPSRPLKCPHCIDISIPIWTTCQMLLAVVKVIDINVTSRVDFELCLFTSSRGLPFFWKTISEKTKMDPPHVRTVQVTPSSIIAQSCSGLGATVQTCCDLVWCACVVFRMGIGLRVKHEVGKHSLICRTRQYTPTQTQNKVHTPTCSICVPSLAHWASSSCLKVRLLLCVCMYVHMYIHGGVFGAPGLLENRSTRAFWSPDGPPAAGACYCSNSTKTNKT